MSASGKAGPWEDLALGVERPESRRGGDIPAAYLTHELRAPVTAIRLGLEMLQEQTEGKLGAEERQLLGFAVRNTARLEGLVDDVMDYSKIMAGRFRLERRPCRAGQLLAEAADSMRSLALAQGVRLAVEPSEPLPRISAEGRRIVQVLTNLISNAVKFTPARGRVTISAE
ncbi:MAG: hypothetical protein KGK30_03385, partial [Elusimicrobia bacterium]|nr:hypothetical protein [Elusimicrobiota bacterium]